MTSRVLLIANRGEVAVRVIRTAAELGFSTVAVRAGDDPADRHGRLADRSIELPGSGPAAYLDIDAVLCAARAAGATHLHPGWGFLSENPALARACEDAGIVFVGPASDVLERLGNKLKARALAARLGIPVLAGTTAAASLAKARAFRDSLGGVAVILKAVAGGGGRGMRVVRSADDLDAAYRRCQSEAESAFGQRDLYVERYMEAARHIEVQIAADATGAAVHLYERDCSLQRRHQKLVETAPAPALEGGTRERILEAAVRLAKAAGYRNIGTFEFLVAADGSLGATSFAFMEANPRLQVEHTVTEELLGIDLVALQLRLADGASLAELGYSAPPPLPSGYAIQARVNAEIMTADGHVVASAGVITTLDLPSGAGIRVDTSAHCAYRVDPRFDSLLAKVIVRSRSAAFEHAVAKLTGALGELHVDGIGTNAGVLRALLRLDKVAEGRATTTFVDEHLAELVDATGTQPAGALGDELGEDGLVAVRSPMTGVVVGVEVTAGSEVRAATDVLVLESMKMEHLVSAGTAGILRDVLVAPGAAVNAGQVIALIEPADVAASHAADNRDLDLARVRPDLAELFERRRLLTDEARTGAVERRHRTGKRTARENLDDLCDPGSFEEYGGFAFAAQTSRRDRQDLIRNTPGDGLVGGIARVNGRLFGPERARCAVLSYDYMVLAGTQGYRNHIKKDRLFDLIERLRLPVVLFAEGGGGRPGDTDAPMIAGLDTTSFAHYGRLSGLVPLIGIVEGRCYAGNAALLGCSDVIIATADSNIGMGGPAMIEGGGLGVFKPEDIGPIDVQAPNGVVDIVVKDDREAVAVAKTYLAYFQGPLESWTCADQRELRHAIPENRLRAYDVRNVIETLADTGSVLELRRQFGIGIVTALARIEGKPIGILANNPSHLGGAIDTPAADKAARFMQLCDAFDLPLLFLCDTPGFMVGPEAERSAQVRHFSRMFVIGASLAVPFFTVVLRKGYGLGAQAMAGGSFRSPLFIVSWPTGEFGGMGLEGAVRLAFRKEMEALGDAAARDELYRNLVALAYERGKALNMAAHLEIDDVIDPAESRRRILDMLASIPPPVPREGKKRSCIDAW